MGIKTNEGWVPKKLGNETRLVKEKLPNWVNRTIFTGDNLDIMRGLDSESVDLVYLDPPFNSNRNYSAPIGSEAAGAAFKDTWELSDVDEAWHGELSDRDPRVYSAICAAGEVHGSGMKSYLIMMAIRLLELRRLMKPSASIYLHCDPTAGAYLKVLMDGVFGRSCFRNEIVWNYLKPQSGASSRFIKSHDTVLFYANDGAVFNEIRDGLVSDAKAVRVRVGYNIAKKDGKRYIYVYDRKRFEDKVATGGIVLEDDDIIRDKDASKGNKLTDVFSMRLLNPNSPERIGYPTQKPLALLERIIRASSNEGDVVLDPFCGCATTCVAAERLGRRWVGIDLSEVAAKLIKKRFQKEGLDGLLNSIIVRDDIPKRTDVVELKDYRTHKHTLFGKQEGKCNGCQISFPFRNMTIDHIIPRTKGGGNNEENLQLLCNACNNVKGNRPMEWLLAKLKEAA